MTIHHDHDHHISPQMRAAISELQAFILAHFPSATFSVGDAQDPDGLYMRAVVGIDDTDQVTQVFIDRMIDLQVEDELPIYVVPVRTPERSAALRQRQQEARAIPA